MKKAAVAGIAALSIAGGSLAVAAIVPVGAALAQDGSTTTTAPAAPGTTGTPGAPGAPGKPGLPFAGKALDDVLGSLVADGTITADQSAKIKARIGDAAAKAREGLAKKGDAARTTFGAALDEIATFLGTTSADLKEQLKTKSLGEIAGDKKPALLTFLTDKINARVDEAVTAGKLTKDQGDKIKAETATRVAKMVDLVGGKGLGGKLAPFRGKRGR